MPERWSPATTCAIASGADDTFVDFDSSLRVAVGKLREALGDDAENPRYVETIPKRGYRFLAPETYPELAHGIGELGASPSSAETAAPDEGRIGAPLVHRSNWSRRWMLTSVLLLIVVAGIAIAFRIFRQQRPQEQAALTAVPFTALPGQATSPAFSPDGSRIAFAWNGDPKRGAKGLRPICEGHRERNSSPPDAASLGMDQSGMVSRRHADRVSTPGRR